jgi:hypothetical protein
VLLNWRVLSRSLIGVVGYLKAAIGDLVVSVLATGPTGHSVVGSNPTEGGGFLWVIKMPSTHFLRRHVKEPYTA